jgi:hypothetical protein
LVDSSDSPSIVDVLCADFDGDDDDELVIYDRSERTLYLIDFHRSDDSSFSGTSIHIHNDVLDPSVLRIRNGDVDGDGREELVYLSETDKGNVVRVLAWNSVTREWEIPYNMEPLYHGRGDNEAYEIVVGDFDGDDHAEVGFLMEKPFRNTFRVFQIHPYYWPPNEFIEYGFW